jgi:myosin heavy subunit
MDTQIAKFNIPDTAIAKMTGEYLPLKIADANDAAGYKAVHEARMVVKSKRVEVEKVRKELKADALEYGRKVDAEAKRITAMLQPIEDHLTAEEEAYFAEKERIKNAARLLAEQEARAKAEAEAVRLKAEQDRIKAEQEAEAKRLQAEREKLASERAAIEAEHTRLLQMEAERMRVIAAEQKRLADIEAERIRAEQMERAKVEAAEKARKETEERIARNAAEAKAKAEREEAARVRAEALRPDREKLLGVAAAIRAVVIPSVSADLQEIARKIKAAIDNAASQVEDYASRIGWGNW